MATGLAAKAIKHFAIVYHHLVNMRGRPLGELQRLNPELRRAEARGPPAWRAASGRVSRSSAFPK
jgi:hypothetical protein